MKKLTDESKPRKKSAKDSAEKIVRDLALAEPHADDWGMKGTVLYDLPKLQVRARRLLKKKKHGKA